MPIAYKVVAGAVALIASAPVRAADGPVVYGVPADFILFALTLLGVALFHRHTLAVALSNMYPEAKSVGRWLYHGWHVALAYVLGFFALFFVLGWHPDPPHKTGAAAPSPPAASAPASSVK